MYRPVYRQIPKTDGILTSLVRGQPGLQELVPGQAPKLQRNSVSNRTNFSVNLLEPLRTIFLEIAAGTKAGFLYSHLSEAIFLKAEKIIVGGSHDFQRFTFSLERLCYKLDN